MFRNSPEVFPHTIGPFDSFWLLAQRFNTTFEAICSVNPQVNPNQLTVGQEVQIPAITIRQQVRGVPAGHGGRCISQAELNLKEEMRLLWNQHAAWTRMAITSLVFNLPDQSFVLARLLRNADDMGEALRPYYGDQVAQRYEALIKNHLVIASELVKAAIKGDQAAVADAEKRWFANGDEIVDFVSRINPHVPKEQFRKMFHQHLNLTKQEAVYMINKQYQEGVDLYDTLEAEVLGMADLLTEAIVKQFPNQFR